MTISKDSLGTFGIVTILRYLFAMICLKKEEGRSMVIVETKNLKKTYDLGFHKVYALKGVNLSIEEGSFVSVIGVSGSGKTSLLNIMGALDSPTEGEVYIKGFKLSNLSQNEQTIFRRRNIGFVFQNFNLIPVLSAYENIILPLKLDGRSIDHDYVDLLLKNLKLEDKIYQMPNTLSGGQQQRVAIARALVTKPAIVFADEPTGNLDSKTGMEVIELLKFLSIKFRQTLMIVTHNDEVAQMSDRIIRLEDGMIC